MGLVLVAPGHDVLLLAAFVCVGLRWWGVVGGRECECNNALTGPKSCRTPRTRRQGRLLVLITPPSHYNKHRPLETSPRLSSSPLAGLASAGVQESGRNITSSSTQPPLNAFFHCYSSSTTIKSMPSTRMRPRPPPSPSLLLLPLVFFLLVSSSPASAFLPVRRVPTPRTRVLSPLHATTAGTGVNVLYSERFLEHKARGYHPENPLRVSVPAQLLKHTPGVHLKTPTTSPEAALAAVLKVHDAAYVEEIRALSARGGGNIDADTFVNGATYDVCLIAAAAWMDCARQTLIGEEEEEEVAAKELVGTAVAAGAGFPIQKESSAAVALARACVRRPCFALTRPPGHHALAGQGMGFCIFNFAAIAARYALDQLRCQRVVILDLDAHHGNGNEAAVRGQPSICYASFHQQDAFPMTGLDPSDRGPHGNLLNVPIPAYSDIKTYLPLLDDKVLPFLLAFKPDLVIVSVGYDCLVDDPLAQLSLGPRDFEAVGERLLRAFGRDKIMFGLEGGYEPENVAAAIVATLKPFL